MSRNSSRAGVDAALKRADAPDAEAVFILRLDDEARAFADAADALKAAGADMPFLGVPITVKDNIDLKGHPTTAGSTLLADAAPAAHDAPVVERLKRAGFVVIGRTNMTEFAFSGLGLNPHYGTPLNPAFPGEARIPGGSSAGAAVSVALGIVPAAIGTDTGGSIRIPAAFCGLTGFKPTADAVSREGVLPLSTMLDAVGVIAGSVADCAGVFDVIRDHPGGPRREPAPGRIRLGLIENYVHGGVEAEVAQAFGAAVAALEAGGVSVERLTMPELDGIPAMLREGTPSAIEAAAWHAPYFAAGRAGEYDPRVLVRIEGGKTMTATALFTLTQRLRALTQAAEARWAGLDAVIWPTVPFIAPTLASLAEDAAYHAANGLALRNSSIVNMIDGCAISIPCPAAAPVGMTLAALHGQDDHLLGVAASIEAMLKGRS